jgi:hypothetical protein
LSKTCLFVPTNGILPYKIPIHTFRNEKRKRAIDQPFSHTSFHLPERAGHSPDKAPLALHIGFQIFRSLPVSFPDCFLLLRQKTVPTKAKAYTELYHKNILFFTRWHETTILREWKAKKSANAPQRLTNAWESATIKVQKGILPIDGQFRKLVTKKVTAFLDQRAVTFLCDLCKQSRLIR